MAGSIKTFVYSTDFNRDCCFNMDESNGRAVGNTDFTLAVINPANFLPGIPAGLSPRTVRYQSDDGRVSRRIIVTTEGGLTALPGTIDAFFATSGTTVTVVTLRLKSIKQEQYRAFTGVDTGLNDGTAD